MSTMLVPSAVKPRSDATAASRPNCLPGIATGIAAVLVFAALLSSSQPASAQFTQQGAKLVGTGAAGNAGQGQSVAISANGNIAIVGAPGDNSQLGAARIFTRSGGVWTQQAKLVANDAAGLAELGYSVGLSADGTTAIVGGPGDNGSIGAAWVFTQSGGSWSQQGLKLVGNGLVGPYPAQGRSVALSADGNTAIVGGPADNPVNNLGTGAVWVFTRSGGVWTEQGNKLVGNGAIGSANQGTAVALSADGNTMIEGGVSDSGDIGAAWIFSRSGSTWTQQGSKLVGTGVVGISIFEGAAVALSADGSTAIVGGPQDNGEAGAAWVFSKSGSVWSQQGSKLVGMGAVANPYVAQGSSVALSGDGNTAIVGGDEDNFSTGAVWVFSRTGSVWTQRGTKLVGNGASSSSYVYQGVSAALSADGNTMIEGGFGDNQNAGAAWIFARVAPTNTHDFNDDGISDILWRNTSGTVAVWLMNGGAIAQAAALGALPSSYAIVGQHDFDGDGKADMLWRDSSGNISMWLMNGAAISSAAAVGNLPSNWSLHGTGDLNGDGKGDLLWRDSGSGTVAVWFMNGATVASTANFGAPPSNWALLGDGYGGVLWRDSAGDIALWGVQNGQVTSSVVLATVTSNFVVQGAGDFDGDGKVDILWRDTNSGALSIWFTNGTQVTSGASIGALPSNWSVAQVGDYNGDGKSDILLIDSAGDLAMWLMNGATVSSSVGVGNVGTTWQVQNFNAN